MIRKSLILVLLGVFLYTPAYLALGLGEIKLNSNLNEPLDAEITLLSVRGETADQIKAMLGTTADFERSGIDRVYFLTRVKFETISAGNGRLVIRLTTEDAVKEPFLNFLVSLEWPNGKLLREYTLLLDPPIFDEAPAAKVTPVEQPRQTTRTQTSSRPASRPAPSAPQFTGDVYGPTSSSDTLWGIASKVKPGGSVSVHRAMVALYEENPQAFMGGNINRLKRGAELRIPSDDAFEQVSQREALRLIREHEQAWREGRDVTTRVVDTSESTSTSAFPSNTSSNQSGRLSLATEEQSDSGTGGSNAAIAEEENLVLKQQNQELEDEKRSQEERIEQLERLLELKNEQLAQLQNSAGDAEQAEQEAAASDAETVVSDSSGDTSADSNASNTSSENAASESSSQPNPQPTPVQQPQQSKGFVDQLLEGVYNLYLLIFAVIIIVIVLIMRFRNNDEVSYQDAIQRTDSNATPKTQSNAFSADDLPETADEVLADDSDMYSDDDIAMDETADPIGEADIYMAYGKFDQAEALLKRAISQDEERADLHAKLLECYAEMDSKASFETHLSDVGPIIDADTELSQMVQEVYSTAWPEGDYYAEDDTEEASDASEFEAEAEVEVDDALDIDDTESETVEEASLDAETLNEDVVDEIDISEDDLDIDDLPSTEDVFGESDTDESDDIAAELDDLDIDTDEELEIEDVTESDEDDDAESNSDIDTQLDLASAYIEMGDYEGAREIIEEVLTTGDSKQKAQAQELLDSIES